MMRLVILSVAILFASAMADPSRNSTVDGYECQEDQLRSCVRELMYMKNIGVTYPSAICPELKKAYQCVGKMADCRNETLKLHVYMTLVNITQHGKGLCMDYNNDTCGQMHFEKCMHAGMDHRGSGGYGGYDGSGDGGYGDRDGSGDNGGYGDKDDGKDNEYGISDRKMEEYKMMCRLGYAEKKCFKGLYKNCSSITVKSAINATVKVLEYSLKDCQDIMGCTEKRRMKCMDPMHMARNMHEECRNVYKVMYCLKDLIDEDCHDDQEREIVSRLSLPRMKQLAEDCRLAGDDGDGDGPGAAASVGVMLPVIGLMSLTAMVFN